MFRFSNSPEGGGLGELSVIPIYVLPKWGATRRASNCSLVK